MPTTRVAVFLGTRPEAIKLAPVIRALEQAPEFEPVLISTGQHREMLDQVAQLFGLRIQEDLAVMRPNQALPELTARLLAACDELLGRLQPELALVQGDTTTVFAAALACFYRRVPVGHVEAGLRTYDRWSPFPEEMNRTLASRLATLHFAPTELARDHLLREGIAAEAISVTGNTVIDALQAEVARQQQPAVRAELSAQLGRTLGSFPLPRPFVLITGHRRENFGRGFQQICAALAALAQRFADHDFIYPVHLNPNVQGPVQALLGGIGNIRLVAPQPYSEFVALMQSCRLVLTDSGGIQEEAPSLGKPVLVMRDTTERPEGVQAGTVQLVGADTAQIVDGVSRLLLDSEAYARMARAANPYGDGRAAERIVGRLRQYLAAASG
ncbi:MAG TPA: UDP-N-acetylglucosamine 2-epimerase (non-hydrolyzing) [Polyangiaceae bacterium]|nr:UDP-N-acetylglucosamine 2-epimerase (non-hydrolyzing) [Polyangiaceae bacterium]